MKKLSYILHGLLFFAICMTMNGCMKDAYKGPDEDEKEKPEPPVPDGEDDYLPDFSVPKNFDWNEAYVKIPLTENVNIDNIKVFFPHLKYNKSFVYSYTFDDCTVMAYSRGFCTINKKWIDYHRFFHVGQERTTGSYPDKTLGYTDGCGNERRFTVGVAIWPDSRNQNIDDFMNPTTHKPDKYYPHLVWKDVAPMLDFGNEIYFHDIDTNGDDTVDGILNGMKKSQNITESFLGRKMKILARPGGNNDYVAAARLYDDIVFTAAEGKTDIGSPLHIAFDNPIDLKNVVQYRRFVESIPSLEQLMPEIDNKAISGTYAWLHDFSHGPENFQYIIDLFTTINDKYGKDGNDCIWFATLDEIYEYNYLRNNCIIEKSVSGNDLILRFSCPSSELPNELMFHRDFSVIIEGVSVQDNTSISSGKNVYGLSYAKQKDENWMININCNKSLMDRAERYTSLYEKEKSASAKEDALYFVNQLREDLRKPFENRIR